MELAVYVSSSSACWWPQKLDMFALALICLLWHGLLSNPPLSVQAQETDANCSEAYDWMRNSLGQSPCLVNAWLGVPCSPQGWITRALPSGGRYPGPSYNSTFSPNPCICNTVSYSTLAACAVCQGHIDGSGIVDWDTYAQDCPGEGIELDGYPKSVPNKTAVPAWAYHDLNSNGMLDLEVALSLANMHLPESTAPAPGPTTTAYTSSAITAATNSASTTLNSSPPSNTARTPDDHTEPSGSRGRTSLIVGGTVGSAFALLLLVLLACALILHRRRTHRSMSTLPLDSVAYPRESEMRTISTDYHVRPYAPSDVYATPAFDLTRKIQGSTIHAPVITPLTPLHLDTTQASRTPVSTGRRHVPHATSPPLHLDASRLPLPESLATSTTVVPVARGFCGKP